MRRSLVCAVLLYLPSFAWAQERVGLSIGRDVAVSLQTKLESAIRGQLADAGSLASSDVTCRVEIARSGADLTLRFRDAEGGPLGDVRTLSLASEELAASEAGTIVRAFVATRMQQGEPKAEFEQARTMPSQPVVAVPPAEAVAAPSKTLGRVSAFYTGNTYASQLRWQQGMRAELALYFPRGLQVGAGYGFHPAVELGLTDARVRIHDHNLSLLLGVGRGATHWGIGGDLVVGLTDTVRQTVQTSRPLAATAASKRWSASTALRLRARLRVISRLWLEFAPALELAFAQRDLATRTADETTVFSPRLVRARLDVGASFELP